MTAQRKTANIPALLQAPLLQATNAERLSMYAVFSTGGKQYRASTGDIVKVEKLEAEKGATIELSSVLLIGEGADVQVGTPFLKGGKVTARVVDHGRGEKINVIKFKRRKNYLKRMGHRQYFITLEITGIDASESAPAQTRAKEAPARKAVAKKVTAKKVAAKNGPAKKASSKKATTRKTAGKKTATKKAAVKKAPVAEDKGDE